MEQYDQLKSADVKSTTSLILLSIGLGGLQGVFAVQFSHGSAHLKSLGLSKPVLALVWLAGPISGAIMQPYLGICSDRCTSSWGKRKPFIISGTLAIIVSLLGFAWTQQIVLAVLEVLSLQLKDSTVTATTAALATLFVFTLNMAIQPVQGGLRALVVDSCPRSQLEVANAWVGRVTGVANILTYSCGFVDLRSIFPDLGNTQFQKLCVIASAILVVTIALECLTVQETYSECERKGAIVPEKDSVVAKLWYLCTSFHRLPLQVQRVCKVQFFAWIGWFPFLFYITTYISDSYTESFFDAATNSTKSESVLARDEGARVGSLAMLMFATISLLSSTTLPLLVGSRQIQKQQLKSHSLRRSLTILQGLSLDIRYLWMMSHIFFACCMFATMFVSTLPGICILVSIAGMSWAVTIWAPFVIIGKEISVRNPDTLRKAFMNDEEGCEKRPGIVLGLHNVAIAVPQMLSAIASSAIFWAFSRGQPGASDGSIGWVLRIAGVSSLVAAFFSRRVGKNVNTRTPVAV